MERIFKSKVDKLLFMPVIIVFAGVCTLMVWDGAWYLALILFPVFAFIYLFSTSIKYVVTGEDVLIYLLGFKVGTVNIKSIKTITETRNPVSSPAASLDRLDLRTEKKGSVLISPEEKEEFLKLVLEINPEITVKRRTKKLPE